MVASRTYTHIVVGAGTAGCLLANRLAQDTSRRVALIESGGSHRFRPWFHVPIGYLFCIGNPRADWMFTTAPCESLGGRSIRYPRGKVLGGCSAINGMIYMRGQARDYGHWAQLLQDSSWSWDSVLPLFKKHERYHGGASKYHGADGEVFVSRQRLKWDVLDGFMSAAIEMGIPKTDDFNTGSNEGVAYFDVNQKDGWRWSAASAFLNNCEGIDVFTKTTVSRVLWDQSPKTAARGVEVIDSRGAVHRIDLDSTDKRSEIILCAGAVNTPLLLMRSGVGPAELLKQSGMDVIHDLPGVGQNLQDHLQIRTVVKIKPEWLTLNRLSQSIVAKLRMGLEYSLFRSGPLSMAPSQLGLFTKSSDAEAHPNIQFHVQPLSLDAFGQPLHSFNAMTISVCNLNPESRGWIVPTRDPFSNPSIVMNYLATQRDREVAVDSVLRAREIAESPAFSPYFDGFYLPKPEARARAEILDEIRRISSTIFHPSCTCSMGIAGKDQHAVVDSQLRLIGHEQIRIADCSVMPKLVSGNTNAPVMMIAEKAAQMLGVGR